MQKSTEFCLIFQNKKLSVIRSERGMAETKVWDKHSKAGNRWCRNGEARGSERAKGKRGRKRWRWRWRWRSIKTCERVSALAVHSLFVFFKRKVEETHTYTRTLVRFFSNKKQKRDRRGCVVFFCVHYYFIIVAILQIILSRLFWLCPKCEPASSLV